MQGFYGDLPVNTGSLILTMGNGAIVKLSSMFRRVRLCQGIFWKGTPSKQSRGSMECGSFNTWIVSMV